ncbi:hypothetical protein Syun_011419 [Stephania yunnanensis]|uniref:Transmembrane protein n=1 Tax=Stephania yunnanensis TaxID=152371 RepID=A0AAP0JY77_9MAGN
MSPIKHVALSSMVVFNMVFVVFVVVVDGVVWIWPSIDSKCFGGVLMGGVKW